MSSELGHTIDDVENLIKKHEAFEKSAAAQEERFGALHRLTTVSFFCIVVLLIMVLLILIVVSMVLVLLNFIVVFALWIC